MEDNYLAHHGVKGMKWGVRRTPQQLGHRTPTKRRKKKSKSSFMRRFGSSAVTKTREAYKTSRAKRLAKRKEKQQIAETRKHNERMDDRAKNDMSSMSDAELQQVINRIQMEKRYSELTAPKPKTKSFVASNLERLASTAIQTAGTRLINNAINKALGSTNQNGGSPVNQENPTKPQKQSTPPKPPKQSRSTENYFDSMVTQPMYFGGKRVTGSDSYDAADNFLKDLVTQPMYFGGKRVTGSDSYDEADDFLKDLVTQPMYFGGKRTRR